MNVAEALAPAARSPTSSVQSVPAGSPAEHDQAQKLARALFRQHGDRDLKKMVESGWLAAPKDDGATQ